MIKIITCMILFMSLSTIGYAGERPQAFSVSPFLGGYTYDGTQHLLTRPVYGLRLGYDLTENWATEGVFDYVAGETTRGHQDINVYSYRMDILYNFMPAGKLVPYLAVGGGGTTIETRHDHDASATFNYGGGLKYFVTDSIALRGDVRHLLAFETHPDTHTLNNLEYTVGLTFLFGGKKPAPAPVAVADATPVAQPEPEAAAAPETPLQPIPAAEPIPEKMKYCVSLGIEFDINKSDIRPQYHDEVAKVGDFMKKYPTTTAVIEGYTDEVGSDDYNMQLSQRRAESVVKYLEDNFGIDSSRLSAKGYGKAEPVAPNATNAGMQKNRRINAVIDCAVDVKELSPPPDRLCMTLKAEFATNSAEIKPRYFDEINKVGEYMKKYPTTTAIIEGHTDSSGNADQNMRLSQQRAESVVTYLVEKCGIERSRLSAKGYGSTRRIAYNNTAEGRQKNRRINAIIDCVIEK
jgi:OOP family OmpA-OmpF porin